MEQCAWTRSRGDQGQLLLALRRVLDSPLVHVDWRCRGDPSLLLGLHWPAPAPLSARRPCTASRSPATGGRSSRRGRSRRGRGRGLLRLVDQRLERRISSFIRMMSGYRRCRSCGGRPARCAGSPAARRRSRPGHVRTGGGAVAAIALASRSFRLARSSPPLGGQAVVLAVDPQLLLEPLERGQVGLHCSGSSPRYCCLQALTRSSCSARRVRARRAGPRRIPRCPSPGARAEVLLDVEGGQRVGHLAATVWGRPRVADGEHGRAPCGPARVARLQLDVRPDARDDACPARTRIAG